MNEYAKLLLGALIASSASVMLIEMAQYWQIGQYLDLTFFDVIPYLSYLHRLTELCKVSEINQYLYISWGISLVCSILSFTPILYIILLDNIESYHLSSVRMWLTPVLLFILIISITGIYRFTFYAPEALTIPMCREINSILKVQLSSVVGAFPLLSLLFCLATVGLVSTVTRRKSPPSKDV